MSMTVALLERLIAFPTISRDSNLALIDFVQAYLEARGFEVHRLKDASGTKAGLFARIGPAERPGVMLSAHSDVVPVAGQDWSGDAFVMRRKEARLYGRGATDMKGFLAAMLALADRAEGAVLAEPLKFAISWDEEVGCIGIPQMLPHLASTIGKPRLCIVGEPTSMQIALGHKGKVALRALCHGRAGHSAQAPLHLNALHMATDFIAGLRGLQADLATTGARDDDYDVGHATLHVGRLSGGAALNIVPDRAEIEFEYRYLAGQPPAMIEQSIRDLAAAVVAPLRAAHPQAAIEVAVTNAYPGLGTAQGSEVATFMQALLPDAPLIKVAYGTEAGHFDAAGIATVVCGPGSMAQGHIADEYIELAQLAACDAMLDRVLSAIAG
jgi:acetylornithine deacetylase